MLSQDKGCANKRMPSVSRKVFCALEQKEFTSVLCVCVCVCVCTCVFVPVLVFLLYEQEAQGSKQNSCLT